MAQPSFNLPVFVDHLTAAIQKDFRLVALVALWILATLCLGGVAAPYERIHVLLAALVSAYLLTLSTKGHPSTDGAEPAPGMRTVVGTLAALLGLALFQLVPLPPWLLGWLSPIKTRLTFETLAGLQIAPSSRGYPLSLDPSATFVFIAQAVGFLAVLAAAMEMLRSQEMRRRVAWGIAAFSAVVGFVGTAHRFSGSGKILWILTRGWTFFGPYVSANHAGALLAVGGTLALSLSYRKQPRISQFMLAAFFFMSALGLLNTGSRAAILVLGITSLLQLRFRLAASKQDPGAKRVLLPAITLTILLALLWQAPSISRVGSTRERIRSGAELRPQIWSSAVTLFTEAPAAGIGFGAFPKASPTVLGDRYFLKVEHAENEYLELLSSGGMVAALLAAFLLFLVIRRVLAVLRSNESATSTRAFALSLVAFLLNGFFVFHAPLPAHQLLFAILLAGTFSSHRVSLLRDSRGRKTAALLCSAAFLLGIVSLFFPRPKVPRPPDLPQIQGNSEADRKAARLIQEAQPDVLAEDLRRDPLDAETLYRFAFHISANGRPGIGARALRAAETLAPFEFKPRFEAIEALATAGAFREAFDASNDLLSGPYPLPSSVLLRLHFNAAYYALRLDDDARIVTHLDQAERIDAKDWRLPLLRSLAAARPENLLMDSWKKSVDQRVRPETWDRSLATLIQARPKAYDVETVLKTIGPHRSDAGSFLVKFARFVPKPLSEVSVRLDAWKKSPRLVALSATAAAAARWAPLVDPMIDPETIDILPSQAHTEPDIFSLPVDLIAAPGGLSFRMVVESAHPVSSQLILIADGRPRITTDPAVRIGPNRWELTFRNVTARIPASDKGPARITGIGFTPLERAGRYSIGPIELFVDSVR